MSAIELFIQHCSFLSPGGRQQPEKQYDRMMTCFCSFFFARLSPLGRSHMRLRKPCWGPYIYDVYVGSRVPKVLMKKSTSAYFCISQRGRVGSTKLRCLLTSYVKCPISYAPLHPFLFRSLPSPENRPMEFPPLLLDYHSTTGCVSKYICITD